ncbi:head completion/stabilization protein [Citrobacter sp. wls828]|uniref:head completion/stabilization protein n=1 Tax=Citrobacter TaxID=544 RepID=UPI0010C9C4DC|nr:MULTISPECIES: head completion/stabilization protein [Citrobacter]MBJ9109977.1 head completion/stabilization protein [Citrobacter sp. FDAARGOS_156]MBK6259091.1 head completion/stabilization protein [Citrobacter youngae]TKU06282.1 head completion/stabilization protein [Citrobacter sp. wls828]
MSMVAKPRVEPAENDTTDIDDGEEKVTAGTFWPDIVLRELRLASRIPGRTTTSRLMYVTTEAVAHVTDELQEWQQQQLAEGYSTLADAPTIKPNGEPEIPPRKINGESINIHRYRRAVYAATRALILENARDVDTTNKSDRKADALDTQAEDLWRDVRWAIADIRGAQRIWAELC